MISFSQISSISFLASLEAMGGIQTGLPAAETLALMREHPQDILRSMAQSQETPLMTLFRLHHQGFERDRRPIFWERTEATKTLLNRLKKEFGKEASPASDEIVARYFSHLATVIEKGKRMSPSRSSWYETYADGIAANATTYDAPESRAVNLALMAINLSLHGFVQWSEKLFAEAESHGAQIEKSMMRTFWEDRLATFWAEAGSTKKARDYFEKRISGVMKSTQDEENKGYALKNIIRSLKEAGLTDLFDRTYRSAVELAEIVRDGSARAALKQALMEAAG